MGTRERSRSAENPLLGMIVDRTSFDEDDPATSKDVRASRSLVGDDDSLSVDSVSSLGVFKKTRSGKVRRKLRWKPPGFKSKRNKKSSGMSVMSSSEKSTRTNQSFMSFHTFHSTETPVIRNRKPATPVVQRPNYPDSFEGVATISNEGSYVHSRMNEKATTRQIPRSQTIPPSTEEKRWGGWDFHSVQTIDGSWGSSESESRANMFDPYGDAIVLDKRGGLPPKAVIPATPRTSSPSSIRTPQSSPKDTLESSPIHTPSTAASSTTEISATGYPLLSTENYEEERQINIFRAAAPPRARSSVSAADVAGGLAVEEVEPLQSSRQSLFIPPDDRPPPTRKSLTPRSGKPPIPRKPASPTSSWNQISRDSSGDYSHAHATSPDAVQAKVPDVNLNQRSNLNALVANSSLLHGMSYVPDRILTDMPLSTHAHKAYYRPIDRSSSTTSSTTEGLRAFSDDDSLSTRNSSKSADVIIEDLQNLSTDGTSTEVSFSTGRKSRASTGPVDLDDGRFLEAEKNLKAIHEMAAEHLHHGEYVEALEVFEEILRGQKERYGAEHYRIGTALHNIGIVHLKSRKYEKAVGVCEEAVRIRKNALAANHPDVAVSLAQLGVAHLECCQYRQALVSFREALEIRRECLGRKHPKVGKLLNNIGCALFAVEELEGAKLSFEEALEIQRETLRGDSNTQSNQILLSIASTLCNVGSIKVRWGLLEEATVSLEEALLIQQSVLGDDHPAVLKTVKSIDFVDRAINGGDDFGSFKSLYTCQTPPTFLAEIGSEVPPVNLSCDASPSVFETPSTSMFLKKSNSEDESASFNCDSAPSAFDKILNSNFVKALNFDKSKKWYQKIEKQLPSTACSGRESPRSEGRYKFRRSRTKRAEI